MLAAIRQAGPALIMGLMVLGGLYLSKLYNYLLFHSLVELFTVLVAFGIFAIAWNTRRIIANNYLLFIGITSLFVGAVDLLHALTYKGMGAFPNHDANLPTQFWLVARYLQGSALLAAPLFLSRKLKPGLTFAAYLALTIVLLAAIFGGIFPACFVEGEGLTPFKKGSEYLVCVMLAGALLFMFRRSDSFDGEIVRLLGWSIGIFIASELSFTLYTDVYGIFNMVGHFLKLAGFFLLYKAIIETCLMHPYSLLFRELKVNQEEVEVLNTELAARAAELQEMNCELEMTLEELGAANQDLETTNRQLETANQELEAFNYTVSHDLRGPLTVIIGYCELLLTASPGRTADEGGGYIRKIFEGSTRMSQLIGTLLDFSRLGRGELTREEVDLSQVAGQVAAELRLREPARRAAFAVQEGITVNGDLRLIRVLVENLLQNAWKYTGKREEAVIEFGATECDGKSCCYVRDNGAGFDMREAHRLFVPFQRLHDREEFEGTGIGLATVRRIVERHGGRIWAEGEIDQGTTFFFTLG